MQECVANGSAATGVLPGGLKVRRRGAAGEARGRRRPLGPPFGPWSGDMSVKYKETSRGGLAVNVVEC
jgi:L-serine deaminase